MRGILESVLHEIDLLLQNQQQLLIAIDVRCAAGKTTLGAHLQRACGCNVIHMDHFFLRPEQRTAERLNEPGGNVDYERFLSEVLIPLKQREPFAYRPYDCGKYELTEAVLVTPHLINIIEGSYSCHPALFPYYDLRIFVTVNESKQLRRIALRNGEAGVKQFKDKWIPLEERYFSAYQIKERCTLCFDTGEALSGGE